MSTHVPPVPPSCTLCSIHQKVQCVLLSRPHGTSTSPGGEGGGGGGYSPGALELSMRPSLVEAAVAVRRVVLYCHVLLL